MGRSPPPYASGSTVLYPLCRLLLGGGGLCSSITSTISSCGVPLLSSMMMVSRLLSLLGGVRVRLLVSCTSITSLAERLGDRATVVVALRIDLERLRL